MDRLAQERNKLLVSGDTILLEANASLKLGLFRQQGIGRAFLTNRRLIWLHMAPRALLAILFWYRARIEIPLTTVRRVWPTGSGILVQTDEERYSLLLSTRYSALFNPFAASELSRTAREWKGTIEKLAPPGAS